MAEKSIELSPMGAKAIVPCDKRPVKAGGGEDRPIRTQTPPVRPRHRLPWLVARDAHIEEQKEDDERTMLINSDPMTDLPSTKKPKDRSTDKAPERFPYHSVSQEEMHPLLKPDEKEPAPNTKAKLGRGVPWRPTLNALPVRDETPKEARESLNQPPLLRHARTTSSIPLEDMTYSLLRSSEESFKHKPTLVPSTTPPLKNRGSGTLKSALDGLEGLMDEALRLAEYGVSHRDPLSSSDQPAHVARREQHPANATGQPLVSYSSSSSATKSRSSLLHLPAKWWSIPESHDGVDSPPVSPLEEPLINPTSQKGSAAFNQPPAGKSRDSKAIDWAYVPRPLRPSQVPSSKSSGSSQSIVRGPVPVHGPTVPSLVLPPNREQYNYLDRKPVDEEEPIDNGRRYYTAPELHQHHFVAGPGRGRRRRGDHHLLPRPPTLDEDLQSQNKNCTTRPYQPFVENMESLPGQVKEAVRGMEDSRRISSIGPEPEDGKLELGDVDLDKLNLRTPRKHHHSLLSHQPFSLSRHHRRQPIARDWHITRKRLVAMVACMNTALLGLIIGIYVSLSEEFAGVMLS